MITTIYNNQKDLPLSIANIKLMVPFLLRTLKISTDEVILHFVTKSAIGKVHDSFFSDPSPTDCISFPLDDSILGEVFVCPQVAIEYANKRNLDPYQETTLYIIHGLLHLLGYDDCEPQERRRMRAAERRALQRLEQLKISL